MVVGRDKKSYAFKRKREFLSRNFIKRVASWNQEYQSQEPILTKKVLRKAIYFTLFNLQSLREKKSSSPSSILKESEKCGKVVIVVEMNQGTLKTESRIVCQFEAKTAKTRKNQHFDFELTDHDQDDYKSMDYIGIR